MHMIQMSRLIIGIDHKLIDLSRIKECFFRFCGNPSPAEQDIIKESAKQETMGSTKTWDRKRPSKTDIVSRKSLSMDSDQDMCSKGNIKKDIGKERVSKLSGLLYTKT